MKSLTLGLGLSYDLLIRCHDQNYPALGDTWSTLYLHNTQQFNFFTDVPATGMYFASYEFLLNQLTPKGKT